MLQDPIRLRAWVGFIVNVVFFSTAHRMVDDSRKQRLREEGRDARRAAIAFEKACKSGNPHALYEAADLLDYTVESWPLAMKRAAALRGLSKDIRQAFLTIWTVHKGLSRRVGHRPTLAKALRVLLPKSRYHGPPIRLYRGTTAHERRRHLYSFSWTAKRAVAERFAHKHNFDGAVVLETCADAAAVLHIRKKLHHKDDEDEYILDPYKLTKVKVLARLPAPADIESFTLRRKRTHKHKRERSGAKLDRRKLSPAD